MGQCPILTYSKDTIFINMKTKQNSIGNLLIQMCVHESHIISVVNNVMTRLYSLKLPMSDIINVDSISKAILETMIYATLIL